MWQHTAKCREIVVNRINTVSSPMEPGVWSVIETICNRSILKNYLNTIMLSVIKEKLMVLFFYCGKNTT